MNEQAAEFIFGSWNAPPVPLKIEYPLEVMEEIRDNVSSGLLQLAYGGLEVGGVLYGVHHEKSICILNWRPIPCEHAEGPSFRLSSRDRTELKRLIEVSTRDPELRLLEPLGWFVSHARRDIFLSDSDLETYNGFFPAPWQVTLVLRPSRGGSTRAGFFARESDGSLKADASHHDFVVEPLRHAFRPKIRSAPEPPAPAQPEPHPVNRQEAVSAQIIEPPAFLTAQSPPKRTPWIWAIPATVAVLVAGFVFKELHAPPSYMPFSLRVLNSGQSVQLEWDQNSAAVRDSQSATIDVQDGGSTSQIALSSEELHSGKTQYLRRSRDVIFDMTVFPHGLAVHENAHLMLVSDAQPRNGPQPAELNQSRAERDQNQAEVKQLREDLRVQTTRADRLREMVRILENRLNIETEAGKK